MHAEAMRKYLLLGELGVPQRNPVHERKPKPAIAKESEYPFDIRKNESQED